MDSLLDPQGDDHADRLPATHSLENRAARPPRLPPSLNEHDAGHATVELASIMTVTSNPVSPGSASPPLDQVRSQDFIPPTRPSSTPFPQPEHRTDDLRCLRCPYNEDDPTDAYDDAEEHYLDEAESEVVDGEYYTPDPDQLEMEMDKMDKTDKMANLADLGDDASQEDGAGFASHADSRATASTTTDAALPCQAPLYEYGTPDLRKLRLSSDTDSSVAIAPSLPLPTDAPPASPALQSSPTVPTAQTAPASPICPPSPACAAGAKRQTLFLHLLPTEVQGLILDHVFDCSMTPMKRSSPDKRLTRLACISPVWRALIQQRLYCHIKLKATGATLSEALIHFAQHDHLRAYVKHVELWFPVFQPKARPPAVTATAMLPTVTHEGLTNASYVLPSDNSSLEEAFYFVSSTFPELSVLTLEGGERKKAPQVRHFVDAGEAEGGSSSGSGGGGSTAMPQITTVRTLLCKGQWNLIRSRADFANIASALPNMEEWRASYSKPKSKSYLSMATILPRLPAHLSALDLCLESDYRQEVAFPPYFLKVCHAVHFCHCLAEATPTLQRLTYTGRVCRSFFDVAARLADPRATRLQSIDLTVKNCCRSYSYGHWHESGSGITDIHFIRAFEALVLSAVRALGRLTAVDHLRIRYVDLDFPVPPLNPFFLLHKGVASGVWSDTIVAELNRVRPEARWEELSDTFGDMAVCKDGRMMINPEFPKKRVVSLKLSNYDYLAALASSM